MGDPRVIPITDLDISGSGNRFIDSITETDMVYFLLNVGNGDAQLLMLPFRDGRRDLVVVDVGRFKVMRELIASLQQGGSFRSRWKLISPLRPIRTGITSLEWVASSISARSMNSGMRASIRVSRLIGRCAIKPRRYPVSASRLVGTRDCLRMLILRYLLRRLH